MEASEICAECEREGQKYQPEMAGESFAGRAAAILARSRIVAREEARDFSHLKATIKSTSDELSLIVETPFTHMTRLTITEDPGEEFTVRGHNSVTDADDDEIVFYSDVTKVQVVPETESFVIQVLTPDFVLEMDFEDADRVREALDQFEAKKVLEVDFDAPSSVRITPSSSEPAGA